MAILGIVGPDVTRPDGHRPVGGPGQTVRAIEHADDSMHPDGRGAIPLAFTSGYPTAPDRAGIVATAESQPHRRKNEIIRCHAGVMPEITPARKPEFCTKRTKWTRVSYEIRPLADGKHSSWTQIYRFHAGLAVWKEFHDWVVAHITKGTVEPSCAALCISPSKSSLSGDGCGGYCASRSVIATPSAIASDGWVMTL